MNRWKAIALDKPIGFYSEYDDVYGWYGVFGAESGFCYSTHLDPGNAADQASKMNKKHVGREKQ